MIKLFPVGESMRKILSFAFLFTLFMAGFAPIVAFCDDGGFRSRVEDVDWKHDGTLAGGCANKKSGDHCTTDKRKFTEDKGMCKLLTAKRGQTAELSCSAQACNEGYLLWFDAKGNNMGVCHTLKAAQDLCDKHKERCSDGKVFGPNLIDNPNTGYEGQGAAYKGCLCQPDCENTYKGNPEAISCCLWESYDRAEWDKSANQCKCKDGNWKYNSETKMGRCLSEPMQNIAQRGITSVPSITTETHMTKRCPYEATGIYPDCDCGPDNRYNKERNMCSRIVRCNENVATWDGSACVCKDEGKIYIENEESVFESKCECPERGQIYKEGKCVKPEPDDITECPTGTHGEYPTCICDDEDKYFEVDENKCVEIDKCPNGSHGTYPYCVCDDENKYFEVDKNQCIEYETETECPAEAPGVYPDCVCDDDNKQYDRKQNKCVSRCNEKVATWNGTECVCEEQDYIYKNGKCEEDPEKRLKKKQQAYDEAKENETSLENRILGGATMAATGLGGMELAMGLAEQKADEAAAEDMAAYLATFRCSYAPGKSVKGGPDPIELPGGNDETFLNLRNEYMTLASSLKERKESLGMKPGLESEEILDKSQMGLYDDENVGVTSGTYSSLYRAMALNSAVDQEKIDADKQTSEKRVNIGGTVGGIGAVGGAVGNSLINGKLGDTIGGGDSGVITGAVDGLLKSE